MSSQSPRRSPRGSLGKLVGYRKKLGLNIPDLSEAVQKLNAIGDADWKYVAACASQDSKCSPQDQARANDIVRAALAGPVPRRQLSPRQVRAASARARSKAKRDAENICKPNSGRGPEICEEEDACTYTENGVCRYRPGESPSPKGRKSLFSAFDGRPQLCSKHGGLIYGDDDRCRAPPKYHLGQAGIPKLTYKTLRAEGVRSPRSRRPRRRAAGPASQYDDANYEDYRDYTSQNYGRRNQYDYEIDRFYEED